MTAKDILSYRKSEQNGSPAIESTMPVLEVLHKLLDSKTRELTVTEEGEAVGIIDESSLLMGLSRMIAPRDDCSIITLECSPQDYSASVIAHAVEDTDAHLVDLLTVPAENGHIHVTLRVRNSDPSSTVRSLERYGFEVLEANSSGASVQSIEIATERLLSLQAIMNV